ncbi:hypothetical protein HETIRDRAFT_427828 [Heterobasidion irregulare TC 32-1]|uniref:Uncharacterized protein n=1 Tax=Heterobasidion irregulare (strain TC 32-1) TaxID=747525 RepID=W4K6M4_HETIT|nr:uncharacterized protein HETIRDRAFT_427828 [Heterobasidion irregulare TC 32-1]ETW80995.1 hypothetical protein HETIRDRAFT_427828 [Heterobasidion irregulare TC 32-1]
MNAEWELKEVPPALAELRDTLTRLLEPKTGASLDSAPSERTLEERKLDYVHLEQGAEPRSQTSTNKSISLFLARNRARNDASNRNEFLYTRAKRRRVSPSSPNSSDDNALYTPSCARADAKPVDRDVMMKFDVARNEEGPLRRTVAKSEMSAITSTVGGTQERRSGVEENAAVSAEKYPALDVRLKDIEAHLAVRYVPSPPVSLLHRLQFLEDHIVRLEREYPPWAALHFSQPRRGWPPPPRATPLIVPSHLTSTSTLTSSAATPNAAVGNGSSAAAIETSKAGVEHEAKGKAKSRTAKSSLHRAVMERLEVQKAIGDLKGDGASY